MAQRSYSPRLPGIIEHPERLQFRGGNALLEKKAKPRYQSKEDCNAKRNTMCYAKVKRLRTPGCTVLRKTAGEINDIWCRIYDTGDNIDRRVRIEEIP